MSNSQKGLPTQAGVSLIITFFIMIIILSVVLSVSALLYSQVKVIRNIGNSMASLYAADSGVEKVLFYDRQALPEGASRGLCAMLDSCTEDPSPNNPSEHGMYCNELSRFGADCEPETCSACEIYFETAFDGRKYFVTTKVYSENGNSVFSIDSKGVFGGAGRQIKIIVNPGE